MAGKSLGIIPNGLLYGYVGTSWSPTVLSPTCWLDASDANTLTVDGSNRVSAWLSKGVFSGSYSQGTGASQPLLETSPSGWNRPVVYFDGATVAKKLTSSAYTSGQKTTLYMVLQEITEVPNDAPKSVIFYGTGTGITSADSFSAEFASSGASRLMYSIVYGSGISQTYGTPAIVPSSPTILCWQWDLSVSGAGSTVALYNGLTGLLVNTASSGSSTGVPGSSQHTLGELNGYRSDIKVGCLLEFNSLHDSSTRSLIYNYLRGWFP